MARRQTSARVAKIAARVLRVGYPLDEAKLRSKLREALANADFATAERDPAKAKQATADAMIDAMGGVLRPLFDDMASLAASCLSQDEEPNA